MAKPDRQMLKILLYPLSIIYSIVARIRNLFFDSNISKSKFFNNVTIISIGNITVGGTGKTPHTEYLVGLLKDKYKIAVLSRGYKRKTKDFLYVNQSNTHQEVGDEPLQIATKFNDIIVAVCANRVEGVKKIKKENDVDIILLDDAFQHRKIKPKISILLTTYNNPYFRDYFLPVGRLRDNKTEYTRADIIIISKSPYDTKPIERSIWKTDINIKPYQELFFSTESYLNLINLFDKNTKIDKNTLANSTILILSGIANPSNFINYVKNNYSKKIIQLKFKDHKNFSKKDIEKIINKFINIKSENKLIITTEKDAMRLKNYNFPENIKQKTFYQPIKIDFLFDSEKKFYNKILTKLKNK